MIETDLNYLAILVAALAGVFVGAIYFSKPVLGYAWKRAANLKRKDQKRGMGVSYTVGGLAQLIMAFIFSAVLPATGATTLWGGIQSAFWFWLGFIATSTLILVAWENKTWSWWALLNGYFLLTLITMALILVSWT